MKHLRLSYRFILLFMHIFLGAFLTILFQHGKNPTHGFKGVFTCWWHRRALSIIGVRYKVYGKPLEQKSLFISNHVSWLDIHIIGVDTPVRFVSKAEVEKWPIMGWLAKKAGTLFIRRGGRHSAMEALNNMTDVLRHNSHVVLFPEGTTTDGRVKRFHHRLIQSAVDAECMMQPIAIRYPHPHGNLNHPATLYIDDTTILHSSIKIKSATDIYAELHYLEPFSAEGKDRKELALTAENMIRNFIENAALEKQKNSL